MLSSRSDSSSNSFGSDKSTSFNKTEANVSKPSVDVEMPSVTPSISEPVSTPVSAEEMIMPTAVIGPKIRFKGELEGEEDLLIQGSIDGTISLSGQNLIIGKQGKLRANSKAKTINVEGKVIGDLEGEERISIRSSSQIQGNIKAERIVLEDGAKFKGSIDMNMDTDFSDFAELNEKKTNVEASSSESKATTPSSANKQTKK